MVKIITDYGFCFGVRKAIEIMEKASKEKEALFLLHPLIHNLEENRSLMAKNNAKILQADSPKGKQYGLVFSAHGHPLEEEIHSKDYTLYDATCPLILNRYEALKKVYDKIPIYFLGKKNHQETLAFLSHFPKMIFLDSDQDLKEQIASLDKQEKIGYLPQTTVSEKKSELCLSLLKEKGDVVFSLPICPLYGERTKKAIDYLKDVDRKNAFFIVCGDKASSNANEIYLAVKKAYPELPGAIALTLEDLDRSALVNKDIYLSSATSASRESVLKLKESLEAF